ncbi:MAG: ATP-binding protein [Pirellulaceae bacterium]
MSASPIVGHESVLQRFAHWLGHGRLAGTWLLAGPEGIGKRLVATHIARCLLCEETAPEELAACGTCPACQQVDAGTHPDLLVVERPVDKNQIPVELLIGSREQRMRAGLCHDIALKPYYGGRRIAIIDDADFLNQEGANCLLKTLEEPPSSAVIFLICSNEQRQLPTIRSRSQVVRFRPLSPQQVEQILSAQSLPEDGPSLSDLAHASDGSLKMATRLADPETFDFRRAWYEQLAGLDPGADDFAESITAFVDGAGKEAAAKRDRLRLLADLGSRFFRNVMFAMCGQSVRGDQVMQTNVQHAANAWPGVAEAAAGCVERCEAVREQVAANANQALVIESLLSDLGRIIRAEVLV